MRRDRGDLSIRTEVSNHGKSAENVRVISSVLDPRIKNLGKRSREPVSIQAGSSKLRATVVVRRPLLWSLEERNLYKLVTE